MNINALIVNSARHLKPYNPGHKVLELCNILEKFEFTTSLVIKNIVYELRYELPNDLESEKIRKSSENFTTRWR